MNLRTTMDDFHPAKWTLCLKKCPFHSMKSAFYRLIIGKVALIHIVVG